MSSPLRLVYAATTTDGRHRFYCWSPCLTPTGLFASTATRLRYRFASVAADSCSLHHGYATLSPWWSNFNFIIFGTSKLYCLYFASFATSPTTTTTRVSTPRHTSPNMMPCYFITTSGVPIFNISTRTSSTCIFTQAMSTRRQEATDLDSMFSCFSTNQRVEGYTNTRLSNFDKLYGKMKQSINQRVNSGSYYLRLRFRADI